VIGGSVETRALGLSADECARYNEMAHISRSKNSMSIDMNATQSAAGKPTIEITSRRGKGTEDLRKRDRQLMYVNCPGYWTKRRKAAMPLIKEDQVLSTWDTPRDAIQAGREKFGLDPICVMKVEARNVQRYALLMEQLKESSCRS